MQSYARWAALFLPLVDNPVDFMSPCSYSHCGHTTVQSPRAPSPLRHALNGNLVLAGQMWVFGTSSDGDSNLLQVSMSPTCRRSSGTDPFQSTRHLGCLLSGLFLHYCQVWWLICGLTRVIVRQHILEVAACIRKTWFFISPSKDDKDAIETNSWDVP